VYALKWACMRDGQADRGARVEVAPVESNRVDERAPQRMDAVQSNRDRRGNVRVACCCPAVGTSCVRDGSGVTVRPCARLRRGPRAVARDARDPAV